MKLQWVFLLPFTLTHWVFHVYFWVVLLWVFLISSVVFFSLWFISIISVRTAIKTALKQENLNPEIEEKLLQLQRYQEKQMKQEPDIPTPVSRVVTPASVSSTRLPSRKRPPSASARNDDEWVMETPKRSRSNRGSDIRKEEV